MAESEPLGVGGLLPGNVSNTAKLPLKRGKLKTIKQRATNQPPGAGTRAVGPPNVDTFARDTVPDVTYTLRHRAQ